MEVKTLLEQKKEWYEFLMTQAVGKSWEQFLHEFITSYCRPSLLGE